MNFGTYLRNLIAAKEKRAKEIRQQIKDATTADEVRALGETLNAVLDELTEAKKQLEKLDKQGDNGNGNGDDDGNGGDNGNGDEGRSGGIPAGAEFRGGNPLASYGLMQPQQRAAADPYATMEYRQAFKAYVQKGTAIPAELRAGGDTGTTVAADIGAIIPTTIMTEFIKDVSKVYGQIYSKVRKLNVKGGVKFPISKLKANFKWITEAKVSEKQKAGDIKDYIEFSYNIGEIRVAQTLLSQVVSLDIFENEIVRIMTEAYVEAMDKGIISGTGSGQLLGITEDDRVTNVVEMTEAELSDWTAWRKKLFAKIPLAKRGQGEFIFTSATVEGCLLTIKDANNRPIFKEATELTIGEAVTAGTFYGRTVTLVEPDVVADYDTATAGDVIGIYWVPSDYAINTNMEFGIKRYFDEDTNEWINKLLVIVDGKILDTSGCYIIKKK